MAGPPRPGLPNGFRRNSGKSSLVGIGEVKVLHPLTFRSRAGDVLFGLPGWCRYFGAHRTFAHFHVTIAETHGHRPIQPDLDPHLRSAQTGSNIGAGNPVDSVVELDRIASAHFSAFYIAQRSRQRMILGERAMCIRSGGWHHSQSLVPPRMNTVSR